MASTDNDIIARLKVEGLNTFKAELAQGSKAADGTTVAIQKMEKAITEATDPKDIQRLTKELEAVKVASEAGATAFESSKAKLRQYKEEATGLAIVLATLKSEGKQGTQTFKDIEKQFEATKKKAGQLSDLISDVNQEIKSIGSDTRGIDNVVRGATLMANGFQLVAGVQALLGVENKKLTEGLLKLNGIMAVTQSIQQIGNELTREDSVVKIAATKATALYNLVVDGSTGLLKLFRLALAGIGIGLVIIAIVELVRNWDKLKEAIFGSTQSLEDFRKKQDEIRSANKQSFDDYETEIKYLVNIKKLTQEAAGLKLSIKRREAEESLKAVYDENIKKLQEYEQAVKNVTFAKDDGLTMSEVELVRSQQKYIPTQKELTEQKRITKEAEIDYKQAVNERIQADEKGVVTAKKVVQTNKKVVQTNKEIVKSIEEIDMVGLNYGINSEKYIQDQIALYTELRSTLDIGTESYIALGEVIEALKKKLAGKQKVEPIDFGDALSGLDKKTTAKRPLTLFERIFGSREENQNAQVRVQNEVKGALKIVSELNKYGDQISSIAEQAIQIRTQNELSLLEDKKNKGLITEKEFEKQSAQIKNEAARKKRAIDIANATAQIPVAVLSAYIAGLQIGGPAAPIVAGILAGVAGAFGIAQVALIAAAPLPKFRDGGSANRIFKGGGLVKGATHEQGGVNAELERDEYVIKGAIVRKHGVGTFDKINSGKLNPILTASKKLKSTSNDMKLYENLSTISSYLKQGYKVDEKGNQILKEISTKLNKSSVYV